jgi:hypothetical protein
MTTEFYFIQLLVTKNTTAAAPVTTSGNATYPSQGIPQGNVTGVMPVFPSGANQLVFARLNINGALMFPTGSNANSYVNLNNTTELTVAFSYPVVGSNAIIDLVAYNTDTLNDHLISFGLIVEVA